MKQENVYYCRRLHFPASSAGEVNQVWAELVVSSGKSFGHATGGSRSEFRFVGVFNPCHLQHGSWSRPKLSTVCCLRRSEAVVLKTQWFRVFVAEVLVYKANGCYSAIL